MATQPTANPAASFYNFYKRYLWQASDFLTWQSAMTDYSKGMMDGTFHGAALQGLGYLSATGLNFTVDGGVAFGPTGNLLVNSTPATGTVTVSNTLPSRHLVVIRPNIVQTNLITSPTNPNLQVPLNQLQQAAVMVLLGTAASAPTYPASGANDVVLFGIRTAAAATGFSNDSIDLEVRDIPGKKTNFQQNFAKYDSRLRPYSLLPNLIGIQPSQLGPNSGGFMLPQAFSYANKGTPSIFPKSSGGAYNGAAGDSFLNFMTGAISGADQASSAFVPTIPTAGNFIVATVSITTGDVVNVLYGVQGTRAQCFSAIQSQTTGAGAGAIQLPSANKLICFVIIGSFDGTNITEVDVIDARGLSSATSQSGLGGNGTLTLAAGPYNVTTALNNGQVLLIDTTTGAIQLNLPAPATNAGLVFTVKDKVGMFGTNACTLHRNAAEKIENLTSDFVMLANYGEWTFNCDGTNWNISAG